MAQIKKQDADVLLTSEQLKTLEKYQARMASFQAELQSYADEFGGIINRHYFNRENGFLDDQQNNLREVVLLQDRCEKLAESLGSDSQELKAFMKEIQKTADVDFSEAAARAPAAAEEAAEEEIPAAEEKVAAEPGTAAAEESAAGADYKDTPLIVRDPGELLDEKTQGGEISIKRFIDELSLREPENRDILYQISNKLRELLYNRKLIGYSATTMVYGRDKTLAQLIEDLQPIFLSDDLCELLIQDRFVGRDELAGLRLACDKGRELIYLVA